MPYPRKGEDKDSYISRAIGIFRNEGYTQDQAIGRAFGFWNSYGGKSHASKKEKRRNH